MDSSASKKSNRSNASLTSVTTNKNSPTCVEKTPASATHMSRDQKDRKPSTATGGSVSNASLTSLKSVKKSSSCTIEKSLSSESHMSRDQKDAISVSRKSSIDAGESVTLSDLRTIESLSTCMENTLSSPKHKSRDFNTAISVLQKSSTATGDSVYDHLVDIIKKIIVERPKNVADHFEDLSRQIRQERFRSDDRTQRGFFQTNYRMDVSEKILAGLVLGTEAIFLSNAIMNECMKKQNHWSSAGIGFPHEKQLQLAASMQRLLTNSIVQNVRFWGTIYGIEKNYHIAEAILTTAETESRISSSEDTLLEMELRQTQTTLKSSIIGDTPSNAELRMAIQSIIKSQHSPSDINCQVYFVCTDFNTEWIELPAVTHEEIVQSRKIRKYCRGNLDDNMNSYPPFPGTEKNYLRALIARISHGTQVTPIKNLPFEDMLDTANWIHTQTEINEFGSIELMAESSSPIPSPSTDELISSNTNSSDRLTNENIGAVNIKNRISVVNPCAIRATLNLHGKNRLSSVHENDNSPVVEVIGDCESATASTSQSEIVESRTCAGDYFDDRIRPWNIVPIDNHCIPDAIVVAQSVIWNGSFTFATQKLVDHVYFGWGHKAATTRHITPTIHFGTEDEYLMYDLECKKPKYD